MRRYRLWYCSSAGEGSNTSVEGGGAGEDTSDLCSIMGVVEGGEGGGCSSFILFSGWLIERDLTATLDGTRNLFLERGIKRAKPFTCFSKSSSPCGSGSAH